MPTLAVVDVVEHRPGRERYQRLVELLNVSLIERASALGWDVDRLPAGDLGTSGLLRRADAADAIVLMGGEDVTPHFYGGVADYPGGGIHVEHADAAQIALVQRTVERGTPLLGICRGQQLVNVALGGTLIQHIESDLSHRLAEAHPHEMEAHGVQVSGALAQILEDGVDVRSSHHQAVGELGAGLRVAALAPDGIVEALEHEVAPLVTVQWHPEHPTSSPTDFDAILGLLSPARATRLAG
jgi:putative glutamine amidotransferase